MVREKKGGKRDSIRIAAPLCNACGLCWEACPDHAIRMGNVARVSAERCTGCGLCVEVCPTGAIVMVGGGEGEER